MRLHSSSPVVLKKFPGTLFLLLLALMVFAPSIWAQPNKNRRAPAAVSNRYLFVIDTSASMKGKGDDIKKVVDEIFLSGASGQLHAGDTIGTWTFNEDVYSELPMQTWVPDEREAAAAKTTDFLKHQKFQKGSHLEKALPDILNLVKNSDILTIFLISNGEGIMNGTGFDQDINSAWAQAIADMKGHRKPVVTVLQTKGGRFTKFTVNFVPWPVVIPELPIQVIAPETAAATPTPAPATAIPASAPPLPLPPAQVNNVPPHRPLVKPQVPVQPTSAPLPITPASVQTPGVAPLTPPPTRINPALSPATASTLPVAPFVPPTAAVVSPANPTSPANPNVSFAPQPSTPLNPPAVTRPPVFPAQPIVPPNSQPSIPNVPPPPGATAASAANHNNFPPGFNPMNLPGAPHPPSRLPVPPAVAPSATNDAPGVAQNSFASRALAFITPASGARSNTYLVAGVILILIAVALILLMVRRSRSASGPSFITQSINNEKR